MWPRRLFFAETRVRWILCDTCTDIDFAKFTVWADHGIFPLPPNSTTNTHYKCVFSGFVFVCHLLYHCIWPPFESTIVQTSLWLKCFWRFNRKERERERERKKNVLWFSCGSVNVILTLYAPPRSGANPPKIRGYATPKGQPWVYRSLYAPASINICPLMGCF